MAYNPNDNEATIPQLPLKALDISDTLLVTDAEGNSGRALTAALAEFVADAVLESGQINEILQQATEAVENASKYSATGRPVAPASTPLPDELVVQASGPGNYTNFGVTVTTEDMNGAVRFMKVGDTWIKTVTDSDTGAKVRTLQNDTTLYIPVTTAWLSESHNGGTANTSNGTITIPSGSHGNDTILFKAQPVVDLTNVAVGDTVRIRTQIAENSAGISNEPGGAARLSHRLLVNRNGSVIPGTVTNNVQTRISNTELTFEMDYVVTAGDTVLYPCVVKTNFVNSSGSPWVWTVRRIDVSNLSKKIAANVLSDAVYDIFNRIKGVKTQSDAQVPQIASLNKFRQDDQQFFIGPSSSFKITTAYPTVTVEVTSRAFIFDAKSGYRWLDPQTLTLNNNDILVLSASSTAYESPNLSVKGAGELLYLRKYAFLSQNDIPSGYAPLGMCSEYSWAPEKQALLDLAGIKTPLAALVAESAKRTYLNERFTDLELKGFLPKLDSRQSSIADKIPNFIQKWRLKFADVNIVLKDGSISTDMDYSEKRDDQAYRPPCCTELNFPSKLEEKLRWKGQQYRRYDAMTVRGGGTAVFTESGTGTTGVTKRLDAAWDWQYSGTQPTVPDYNGLTRVLSGPTPTVAYTFPDAHSRCDFIYRTDYISSAAITVAIAGGNGFVQVQNAAGAWVEANGYTFSAKEPDVVYPGTSPVGLPSTGLRKTIYQKRLNMRRSSTSGSRNVTITATDGGRLGYWGIQFGKKDVMINFINSARGSHNISKLRLFEEWDQDYWKPDMIVYMCNTINESSSAAAPTTSLTPTAFADAFQVYINSMLGKAYSPDVTAAISFCMRGQALVNSDDVYQSTIATGYGRATLVDYHDTLFNVLKSLPIGAMNAFHDYIDIAQRRAAANGTTIYYEMHGRTGAASDSFTVDTTHLNTYGEEIRSRKFLPEFNF